MLQERVSVEAGNERAIALDKMADILDLRGLKCPLPVLKTRQRMKAMAAGTELVVLCDDPLAAIDIPHFCSEFGQIVVGIEDQGDAGHRFHLRRTDAPLRRQ